jgi:prepilin signal peptidase PulO-like enzyme (type II secretory pathway)
MFVIPYISACKTILIDIAPGMPPDIWWVTALVVFILALAATIDAFTTTVPDSLIFLGLLAITGMQGWYASWAVAAMHLRQAIEAGVLIWAINLMWYWKFRNDALGMGDAKWTMLAVACFGWLAGVIAWGAGACLAVVWLCVAWLVKRPVDRVTFAPFLMAGLMLGLWWMRIM